MAPGAAPLRNRSPRFCSPVFSRISRPGVSDLAPHPLVGGTCLYRSDPGAKVLTPGLGFQYFLHVQTRGEENVLGLMTQRAGDCTSSELLPVDIGRPFKSRQWQDIDRKPFWMTFGLKGCLRAGLSKVGPRSSRHPRRHFRTYRSSHGGGAIQFLKHNFRPVHKPRFY